MNTFPSTADASQTKVWFYADADNIPQGPLSFRELRDLVTKATISSETLIIAQGCQEWMPFARLFPPGKNTDVGGRRRSFTEARWIVIFFLVAAWPLGLVLLWKSDRFEERTKEIIALIFSIPFTLMFAAVGGTSFMVVVVAAFSLLIWLKLQFSTPVKVFATAGMVAFGAMMLNVIPDQSEASSASTYSPSVSVTPVVAQSEKPETVAVVPNNPGPVKKRPLEESAAYKLASLDAGYPLNYDEHVIREYQVMLQQLSSLTGLNEEMISSRGWVATKELRGRGVHLPTLVLLNDTFVALSSAPEGNSFDAVLAAVTILKFSESRGR